MGRTSRLPRSRTTRQSFRVFSKPPHTACRHRRALPRPPARPLRHCQSFSPLHLESSCCGLRLQRARPLPGNALRLPSPCPCSRPSLLLLSLRVSSWSSPVAFSLVQKALRSCECPASCPCFLKFDT